VDDDELRDTLPTDLERLLASTLALMTTWYQCPQPAICRQLIDNLALIGGHEMVAGPLRRACASSTVRWAAYLEEAERALRACEAQEEQRAADEEQDDTVTLRLPGGGPVTLH